MHKKIFQISLVSILFVSFATQSIMEYMAEDYILQCDMADDKAGDTDRDELKRDDDKLDDDKLENESFACIYLDHLQTGFSGKNCLYIHIHSGIFDQEIPTPPPELC